MDEEDGENKRRNDGNVVLIADPRSQQEKQPPQLSLSYGWSDLYIPPAKRGRLQEQQEKQEQQQENFKKEAEEEEEEGAIEEEEDGCKQREREEAIQRETWWRQSRKINGCINRLSVQNIRELVLDVLGNVNLIRMRGCLAHSLLQAMTSTSSSSYLSLYASFLAVLHSKLPAVGQVTVHRCVAQFRTAFRQRNKARVLSLSLTLSHLFVQSVVHELLILQVLTLLLSSPTNDSLAIAIAVFEIVGSTLHTVSSAGYRAISDQMRAILASQRDLHPKLQQELEALLQNRPQFTLNPLLDLVELEDQITLSDLDLDQPDLETHYELNTFTYDPEYAQHENEWTAIQRELLGLNSDDEDEEEEEDASGEEETDNQEEEKAAEAMQVDGDTTVAAASGTNHSTALLQVKDLTEADLVHLRRTIYLTIMSSARADETVHKLAGIEIPPGREEELVNMMLECCAQERTFQKSYGEMGRAFCLKEDRWKHAFEAAFAQQYATIHRLETNKLRNVSKFFAHLLHTHALPWSVFENIKMTEEATTSSSRIFVKILLQELLAALGMQTLIRLFELNNGNTTTTTNNNNNSEPKTLWFQGLFPMQANVRETRYAINFLTSIGLGPLTDSMRQYLKNAPMIALQQKALLEQQKQNKKDEDESVESSVLSSSSSSGSSSSSSSSSVSSSSSDSRRKRRRKRSSQGGGKHRRNKQRQRKQTKSRHSSSSGSSSDSDELSPRRRRKKEGPKDDDDAGEGKPRRKRESSRRRDDGRRRGGHDDDSSEEEPRRKEKTTETRRRHDEKSADDKKKQPRDEDDASSREGAKRSKRRHEDPHRRRDKTKPRDDNDNDEESSRGRDAKGERREQVNHSTGDTESTTASNRAT